MAAPGEVDAGAQGAAHVADPRVEALQHDGAQRAQVGAMEQELLLQLALACGWALGVSAEVHLLSVALRSTMCPTWWCTGLTDKNCSCSSPSPVARMATSA